MAATPVAQEPLKAFGYRTSTVSTTVGDSLALPPNPADANAPSQFSNQGTQLSTEDLRYLDEHVTEPASILPHGLYTKDLPSGAEVTAFGPFAPTVPGDPHSDLARFTLIGLNW